jgi:hypothetical protein
MACRQTLGRYPDFFGKSEKSGLEPYDVVSGKFPAPGAIRNNYSPPGGEIRALIAPENTGKKQAEPGQSWTIRPPPQFFLR